jgi:hypothetical protein
MSISIQNIILSFTLLICNSMYSQNGNNTQLIPPGPIGWNASKEHKIYTPEILYEYINGGAELYISYGMQSVISVQYKKYGIGEIRVEIFDMGNPENAFGVFTHSRTKNEFLFGQGSQYFTGAQIFWKSKYFISVIADDENEEIKAAIAELSREIDNRITDNGHVPEIIELLPTTNLVEDGYIFFHHYIWLNSYYFISNENIFNINENCRAILSKYNMDNRTLYLLLIQYENPEKAEQANQVFLNEFLDNQIGINIAQVEDNTWLTGTRSNEYFIAIFNAHSKESATILKQQVIKNIKAN